MSSTPCTAASIPSVPDPHSLRLLARILHATIRLGRPENYPQTFSITSSAYAMDVFGSVVNICSFIDLASKLAITLSSYVSDIKSAEDSRKRLLDELRRYMLVLEELKSLMQRREEEDSFNQTESLKILASLFQQDDSQPMDLYCELKALLTWLERNAAGSGGMNLMEKIRWPVEGKRRVERLIPILSRHIQMFTLVLSVTAWCVLRIVIVFLSSQLAS